MFTFESYETSRLRWEMLQHRPSTQLKNNKSIVRIDFIKRNWFCMVWRGSDYSSWDYRADAALLCWPWEQQDARGDGGLSLFFACCDVKQKLSAGWLNVISRWERHRTHLVSKLVTPGLTVTHFNDIGILNAPELSESRSSQWVFVVVT